MAVDIIKFRFCHIVNMNEKRLCMADTPRVTVYPVVTVNFFKMTFFSEYGDVIIT